MSDQESCKHKTQVGGLVGQLKYEKTTLKYREQKRKFTRLGIVSSTKLT